MSAWDDLAAELDRWDRTAELWWRDDDAVRPGPALDRLLDLAGERPLALAVIPALADAGLPLRLDEKEGHVVLQHGYAHRDHARPGERKIELGGRPPDEVLAELEAGRGRLDELFGGLSLPVVVPPWNRIEETVADRLADAGWRGLSALGPRQALTRSGLMIVNVHADLIDWKGSRGFAGEARVLGSLVGHLRARRTGEADAAEPTGLMTHHADHDEACWCFLCALLRFLDRRPVRWLGAAEVFGLPLDSPGSVG